MPAVSTRARVAIQRTGVSNKCTAVRRKVAAHRYGNSRATCDRTVLPAAGGRGDIPALTPAEAGTRLGDPGGMRG